MITVPDPRAGSMVQRQPAARQARTVQGIAALERLLPLGESDTGQARRVRRFLLGLYNGQAFPFDLTDLRCLDEAVQADCITALVMDMDGPEVEIHHRLPAASAIARWAEEDWPHGDE